MSLTRIQKLKLGASGAMLLTAGYLYFYGKSALRETARQNINNSRSATAVENAAEAQGVKPKAVLFVPGAVYPLVNKPGNRSPLVHRQGIGTYFVDASRMSTPNYYGQLYIDQLWQDLNNKTNLPESPAQQLIHRYQQLRLWDHMSGRIPRSDLAAQNAGNETPAIISSNATAAWRAVNGLREEFTRRKVQIKPQELEGAIDVQFNRLDKGDRITPGSYPAHGLQKDLLLQRLSESASKNRPQGAVD